VLVGILMLTVSVPSLLLILAVMLVPALSTPVEDPPDRSCDKFARRQMKLGKRQPSHASLSEFMK
jgi:hypothetical protein